MNSSTANAQLAGEWRLLVPHQQKANNEIQASVITLNEFGKITDAKGQGRPITGDLVVRANCRVTGAIEAKYSGTSTAYAITGILIQGSTATPGSMTLIGTFNNNSHIMFTAHQWP